jgi:ATP-dependent DNA helicase RecQ
MKVVIVAKTRRGKGACVGGLTFDGRSLRLEAHDAQFNETAGLEYTIGDVWEIEGTEPTELIPPHVENIIVNEKRKLPPLTDLPAFIQQQMPPCAGGLDVLYEGLTQATSAGALYVAERIGIPPYSTMFWRPDQPLQRDDDAKRIRYRYPTEDGGRTLTFVGFQEPLSQIPAGTLLRVSLAHRWRPDEMPEGELRCYVQLSGWYLPQPVDEWGWEREPELEEEWQPVDVVPNAAIETVAQRPLTLQTAQDLLKTVFGYDEFRGLQANIIQNILKKRDSVAIMPTGSGKSLCYQLPALMFDGLTVVVSPLISLMEDQVSSLRELGVTAVYLNSTLNYEQYLYTAQQIRQGRVKLLYVAPETLLRPETLVLLDESRVAILAIDEAHCISAWGHDFRPEYRQLSTVRQRLSQAVADGSLPTIALTATATPRVRRDIRHSLGLDKANEFLASFNRENLFLEVQPKTEGLRQVLSFLADHREQSGIIYCATRKQVDTLTDQLAANGWSALPYHAGLDDATRRRHQRQFSHDDVAIMVATIAFGMGIDKSNVRFIIHYDLPQNLESYYQQIGRAGRDGLRADCLLLFSYSDVQTINFFINQQAPSEQKGAAARLQAMIGFAETNVCRRSPLLEYFGEKYNADTCEMCDNCLAEDEELIDVTIPAQKFLSCVKRTGEIFGMTHVIDVLRGSQSQKILQRRHNELSTYGIGTEFSKKQWQHLARQFIQQGLMLQDMEHGSLKLTPKAYAIFKGEAVMGTVQEERQVAAVRPSLLDHDPALFAHLRAKRKELADAANVPPYVIFSDRSLVEMAAYFPQSRASFATMYGVGQAKLEKYADLFLSLIQTYCQANQIVEKDKTAVTPSQPRRESDVVLQPRTVEIGLAYNEGKTVEEITAVLGIQQRTIIGHLYKYAQAGHPLRPDGFREMSQLSAEMQEKVIAVYAELGTDFLRPVYEALEETVGWDELHIMRLYVLSQIGKNATKSG